VLPVAARAVRDGTPRSSTFPPASINDTNRKTIARTNYIPAGAAFSHLGKSNVMVNHNFDLLNLDLEHRVCSHHCLKF
jgi:hypothetical protein